MAFDSDLETAASENGGDSSQRGMPVFQQVSLAAIEKSNFSHTDDQALRGYPHLDFVLANFCSQRVLELAPQFVYINAEAGRSVICRSCSRNFDQMKGSIRELRVGYAGAPWYAHVFHRRTRKYA